MQFLSWLWENWYVLVLLIIFFSGLFTVNQGYVGVITMFGKYRRIVRPGPNIKIPVLEVIYKRVSVQNRSVELEFQAVTKDRANVYFKSMLLYAVQNAEEETIKNELSNFNKNNGQGLTINIVKEIIPPYEMSQKFIIFNIHK